MTEPRINDLLSYNKYKKNLTLQVGLTLVDLFGPQKVFLSRLVDILESPQPPQKWLTGA